MYTVVVSGEAFCPIQIVSQGFVPGRWLIDSRINGQRSLYPPDSVPSSD